MDNESREVTILHDDDPHYPYSDVLDGAVH